MRAGGVDWYTKGIITTTINFPNGKTVCEYCCYCKHKTTKGQTRHICVKTYESIQNPAAQRGKDCPLIIIRE